ncbi:hypothetical protein HX813_29880 [Pseudomonas yamanorum]|nr:hypothetical protein [Pseudomonas yamanorum]
MSLPEHLISPTFVHALHIPGLVLEHPAIMVANLNLRRLEWIEWWILENSDVAERLKAEFENGLHTFLVVERPDFQGNDAAATVLESGDAERLHLLVTALRIAKQGLLRNPSGSMQYTRRHDLNKRTPGLFGRSLFEPDMAKQYKLRADDITLVEAIMADISHPEVVEERTIQLALRHFDASYDHYLDREERLLHAFTALEATYGEYKKQARPIKGISLGQAAAALWPQVTGVHISKFLDEKTQARGLRNAAAHGDFTNWPSKQTDVMIEQLREILRVGLRCLLKMAVQKKSLKNELENISLGLSSTPAKAAFQNVLSNAARGSSSAVGLLQKLISSK